MHWLPESVYLYPLYVRPLTGLDGRAAVWDAQRLDLYRAGRDHLAALGYEQISMRHFRRGDAPPARLSEYTCQEDGMIGLGAGARSYTGSAHYSRDFAVSRRGVLSIIESYCGSTEDDFAHAHTGCDVGRGDAIRRYAMKSILNRAGLDIARFAARFGASPLALLPDLARLCGAGYLRMEGGTLVPTASGLEWSDAIGPFLYSSAVTGRMDAFEVA
jgi:oxygen-independent coproporphyrinogen-3 oxidase